MNEFLARLKQRKLVQWALAYIAAAFALIQVLDVIAQRFGWGDRLEKALILALVVGFFVMLVLAWYHGDRGAQRVGGTELVIIALLLAIGGGVLWRFARAPETVVSASPPAAQASAAAGPIQLQAVATPAANPAQSIPAKSIAVLPFENLSGDKDNAYFVAGMQDLILTKLADIGDLKVISRTSTAKYASRPDDLKTIGRQLGVATILEGSVQKAGEQVLVNVQLIDVSSNSHLWAQSYERTLDNIFGVEGEVAQKIADALQAKLTHAEAVSVEVVPTRSPVAYDLFLRAEYLARKGNLNYDTAGMKAALPLYRQSLEADPEFALAWARLSYYESWIAWHGGGGGDVKHLNKQARADADSALQLQPDLAASQIANGYCAYYGRADFSAALQAFAAALKLKPNDVDALAAQAYVERRLSRLDAAFASFQRALTLDPRNSFLTSELGMAYMLGNRYSEAERAFRRALAIDPDNRNAKVNYSNSIVFDRGDVVQALVVAAGDAAALKLQRVTLLTYQRKYQDALALLDSIPEAPDIFAPVVNGPKTLQQVGGIKAQQQAYLYRLMGDTVAARRLYAQVLPVATKQLEFQEGINLAAAWQAVASAGLGLGDIAAGLDAVSRAQVIDGKSEDRTFKARDMVANAALYAQADRPALGAALLARALSAPNIGYSYSPVLLWLDPAWDPIRHDPRFEALLAKYARYKPAIRYDATSTASSSVAAH